MYLRRVLKKILFLHPENHLDRRIRRFYGYGKKIQAQNYGTENFQGLWSLTKGHK